MLKPETSRACWNQVDVGLTLGEYNIVHLLASNAGSFVTYRAVYDRLRYEGFIAGTGDDGYRANVRSAIKRIRNKFRACDPAFDEIENYTGFGYCWRKPAKSGLAKIDFERAARWSSAGTAPSARRSLSD